MHTVLETPNFRANCKAAGVSEAELRVIVDTIAARPLAGERPDLTAAQRDVLRTVLATIAQGYRNRRT